MNLRAFWKRVVWQEPWLCPSLRKMGQREGLRSSTSSRRRWCYVTAPCCCAAATSAAMRTSLPSHTPWTVGRPRLGLTAFSASWPLRWVSARSSLSSVCGTCAVCLRWPSTGLLWAGRGKRHTMPQRRRRPRLWCTSRALPTGGFLMVTAGQPRQCYRRSIRNPARACRSFNSVIWLSLAGTMFATVVTMRCLRWRFTMDVWLCDPWLTSWRRDLSCSSGRTETCSLDTVVPLAVCFQCRAGRHSALQWGVARAPHLRQSVFAPRCGSVRWGVVGLPLLSNQIGASSGPTNPPQWFEPSAGTLQCVLQCDMCSLLTFTVLFAWTWNQVSASSTSFGRCGVSAVGFAPWCWAESEWGDLVGNLLEFGHSALTRCPDFVVKGHVPFETFQEGACGKFTSIQKGADPILKWRRFVDACWCLRS